MRFIFLFSFLVFTACARVSSSYSPGLQLKAEPKKSFSSVEYFSCPQSRGALRIGTASVSGNGYASFDDLIKEAKRLAAKSGGDFILSEKSGVDTTTACTPGYSTYQANSSANYGVYSGYGSSTAHGYSVGPQSYTIYNPWSIFSVWIYTPAQLGIRMEKNNIISGFRLKSDAPTADVKIGDVLIGLDGIDIDDNKVFDHVMLLQPGDKVTLSLKRGGERLERQITALPN